MAQIHLDYGSNRNCPQHRRVCVFERSCSLFLLNSLSKLAPSTHCTDTKRREEFWCMDAESWASRPTLSLLCGASKSVAGVQKFRRSRGSQNVKEPIGMSLWGENPKVAAGERQTSSRGYWIRTMHPAAALQSSLWSSPTKCIDCVLTWHGTYSGRENKPSKIRSWVRKKLNVIFGRFAWI